MKDFNYKSIDDLLHSRIRLAVISFLSGCEESDYTTIKNSVGASDGNITSHLRKLEDADYVTMRKDFVGRKPITYYKISSKGKNAFVAYVENLKKFIK